MSKRNVGYTFANTKSRKRHRSIVWSLTNVVDQRHESLTRSGWETRNHLLNFQASACLGSCGALYPQKSRLLDASCNQRSPHAQIQSYLISSLHVETLLSLWSWHATIIGTDVCSNTELFRCQNTNGTLSEHRYLQTEKYGEWKASSTPTGADFIFSFSSWSFSVSLH